MAKPRLIPPRARAGARTNVVRWRGRAASWAVAFGVTACGSGAAGPTGPSAPPTAPSVSSGTAIERFFPLVEGTIYSYVTEDDEGERGLLLARVSRPSPTHGSLQLGGTTRHIEYATDGVKLATAHGRSVYLLKQPLTVGNQWPGEHGGSVEIVAVDARAQVPAGQFAGCVKTVEQRGGDRPLRVATTFCPDTGIVLMEASTNTQSERAALKSYGPPVDIGPPGVTRLP